MNHEFDCICDDGSGEERAAKIVGLRKLTLQGDFEVVDEMYRQWQERKAKGGSEKIAFQMQDGGDEEDSDLDSDDSYEDEDGDVDMDEAPRLVKAPKQKVLPKVDEEGFTEVLSRKNR